MDIRSDSNRNPTEPIKPRQPIVLSIVFWVLVLWILLGWLRFARALIDRAMITELLPGWYFWYFVLAGLSWGLVGLPAIWGILRRASWTPGSIWIIGLFYPVHYWVERLFLWAPSEAKNNWPFMLLLTVLWIASIVWASTSKQTKRFFENKKI